MKKRRYFLFVLVIIIAGLGGYFWTGNSDKILQHLGLAKKNIVYGQDTPNLTYLTPKDIDNCLAIQVNDASASGKLMRLMMNYLKEKEGVSSDASFVGTWVKGTECFRLRISNLELYATKDNYLVILKNGKEYKRITPEASML